ncbi:unnamed protein product [Aureobasidium vineae]|uniref:Uncharacterized protein n=1 Tax=Aureobasidium vineae TaxID=2773715 RepID=A0A9N8JJS1_9PEZI|nr:unnamed protein product [Aureobasidium vineae]
MDYRHSSEHFIQPTDITKEFGLDNMHAGTGDESQQPLIVDESDDDATAHPEATRNEANRLIWLLTLSAGLSGLLFGYE